MNHIVLESESDARVKKGEKNNFYSSPYHRHLFQEGLISSFDIFGVTGSLDIDELLSIKSETLYETFRKNFSEVSNYLNESINTIESYVKNEID